MVTRVFIKIESYLFTLCQIPTQASSRNPGQLSDLPYSHSTFSLGTCYFFVGLWKLRNGIYELF